MAYCRLSFMYLHTVSLPEFCCVSVKVFLVINPGFKAACCLVSFLFLLNWQC